MIEDARPSSNAPTSAPRGNNGAADDPARVERISGVVLRITYHNRENDYSVVKLSPDGAVDRSRLDSRREVVLVGNLPGIEPGQALEAEGEWMQHPKHGPQFKAAWFKPTLPKGLKGIETYLSSGSLKGIGPVLAERIVKAFGTDTFRVLEEEIEKLRRIKGMSPKRVEQVRKSWREARGDRELITFLGDYGISPAWANRLRKAYGEAALSVVRANPYRLAAEVRGIGFHRADLIARRIGLALDSPERIEAALAHVLETQSGEGHTYLVRPTLVDLAGRLTELPPQTIEPVLETMLAASKLRQEEIEGQTCVFMNSLHEAETESARHMRRLLAAERRLPRLDPAQFLARFEAQTRLEMAPAQREAALAVAREGLMVLTGGPGTGKTTTLRAVIEMFTAGGRNVRLAAPTGRAARRLSEATHHPAETIHRLLGFQAHSGSFLQDDANPLDADLVVVDEVSMLDVVLAHDLLKALRAGTCLLLVGDRDQLPSVGPGNVLRDLIESQRLPVVELTEVFRQAQASLIVTNAHRINQGEAPQFETPPGATDPDFFFIERESPAEIAETIRTLVTERIPRKFRLNPIADVQVLTPMRRGDLGVHALNRVLQTSLNAAAAPSGKPLPFAGDDEATAGNDGFDRSEFHAGDRVMQMSNDYERDVSNGDVGIVKRVDSETDEVLVQFGDRTVAYLADEIRQLSLAYATTIHKSQGSEYPAVIIPVHTQHYVMLQRNLIYTAVTRGRQLVCLVGQKRALWKAIRNAQKLERNSALGVYLRRGANR